VPSARRASASRGSKVPTYATRSITSTSLRTRWAYTGRLSAANRSRRCCRRLRCVTAQDRRPPSTAISCTVSTPSARHNAHL